MKQTPISITTGIPAGMDYIATRKVTILGHDFQNGDPIPTEVTDKLTNRSLRQLWEWRRIAPINGGVEFVTGGVKRQHQIDKAAEAARAAKAARDARGATEASQEQETGVPEGADAGEGDSTAPATFSRPYAKISKGGGWFKVLDANGQTVEESLRSDDADALLEGNEDSEG